MRMSRAFILAFTVIFPIAGGLASAAPSPKNNHATQSESGKKPGKSCDKLDRDSDAFKDCVAKEAHGSKSPGSHGKGSKAQ